MIKAVIFDLDHTLYNFMDAHEAANEALFSYIREHFGMEAEEADAAIQKAMDDTNAKIGMDIAATHSRTLRYQTFLEEHGFDPIAHANVMANVYWDSFYDAMEREEAVVKFLKALKEKGITILIATDMLAYVQFEKIRRLGLSDYIDYLVTSEEAGAEKPGERILSLCAKKAGCLAEECVFVGDHPKKDVLGPMEYGMQAVWCTFFDPARFMKFFGVTITDEERGRIENIMDSFEDCICDDGSIKMGSIVIE